DAARLDQRPDLFFQRIANLALFAVRPAAKARGRKRQELPLNDPEVDFDLRAFLIRDIHDTALARERLQVPHHIIATDHVEDDVDALTGRLLLHDLNKVFGPVIDRALSAELDAGGAF